MTTISATTENTVTDILALTPAALEKMRDWVKADNPQSGVRVGVAGGGCAGLSYQMDPCEAPNPEDKVQWVENIPLYLHPMVIPYLKGMTIDYVNAMIDGGFKFINPNATNTCGCGTSFGV